MIKRILILSLGISLFLPVGCKKYEEGPAFSLLTKKARVVGKWEFEINPNTNTIYWGSSYVGTSLFNEDIVEFTKDMKVLWNDVDYGSWRFDDDKENIILHPGSSDLYWYILRLKNNELWVYISSGATPDTWEYHFKRLK